MGEERFFRFFCFIVERGWVFFGGLDFGSPLRVGSASLIVFSRTGMVVLGPNHSSVTRKSESLKLFSVRFRQNEGKDFSGSV